MRPQIEPPTHQSNPADSDPQPAVKIAAVASRLYPATSAARIAASFLVSLMAPLWQYSDRREGSAMPATFDAHIPRKRRRELPFS
jgi:hypothetical protein